MTAKTRRPTRRKVALQAQPAPKAKRTTAAGAYLAVKAAPRGPRVSAPGPPVKTALAVGVIHHRRTRLRRARQSRPAARRTPSATPTRSITRPTSRRPQNAPQRVRRSTPRVSVKRPSAPGLHHPFVSKKQWRYFFASKNPKLRRLADAKAHATMARGGYHSLPLRKRAPTIRSAR